MSILDEIDQLKQTVTDGMAQLQKEAADGSAALRGEAKMLSEQLGAFVPREFKLTTAKGEAVTVSDRDALVLFAAVPICLGRKIAKVKLANGQTVDLMWTDLEQFSAAILA